MDINAMDVDEAEGGIESISIFMNILELCNLEKDLRKTRIVPLLYMHKQIKAFLTKNSVVMYP